MVQPKAGVVADGGRVAFSASRRSKMAVVSAGRKLRYGNSLARMRACAHTHLHFVHCAGCSVVAAADSNCWVHKQDFI